VQTVRSEALIYEFFPARPQQENPALLLMQPTMCKTEAIETALRVEDVSAGQREPRPSVSGPLDVVGVLDPGTRMPLRTD
jgi:hypothetical protein